MFQTTNQVIEGTVTKMNCTECLYLQLICSATHAILSVQPLLDWLQHLVFF